MPHKMENILHHEIFKNKKNQILFLHCISTLKVNCLIDWKFYLKHSNILSNTYYFQWPSHLFTIDDKSYMLGLHVQYIQIKHLI